MAAIYLRMEVECGWMRVESQPEEEKSLQILKKKVSKPGISHHSKELSKYIQFKFKMPVSKDEIKQDTLLYKKKKK